MTIPVDGRLPSQNELTGMLSGGEVMYIVSPGNNTQGQSFKITTQTLSVFFGSFSLSNTVILTTGASYNSLVTDARILLNLGIAAPFTVTLLGSSSYSHPVLIKDIAGDVDGTNTLTINFTGGQLADGQSSVVLRNAYAGVWLNPLSNGWYLTAA